ncbi:MAG: (Fe-S)-binding protein [Nitrososphaeria archaeon]|jgi:hypothetical protein
MPAENCGLCGNMTCRLATMAIFKGRMDPSECHFLVNENKENLDDIYKLVDEGINNDLVEYKTGFESITPCISDPAKLMFIYYPPRVENLIINLFDEKLMRNLLDEQSIFASKSSPELGFYRIENEKGEYIMAFARGKFITKQALTEVSGKTILQNVINLTWLSKTSCEFGYTVMDGLQGLCNCMDTVASINSGPEKIVMKEKSFTTISTEKPETFFDQLVKTVSENIASSNVNKYLQVCSINLKKHVDLLTLSESGEDAITKAKLVSKWQALNEFLKVGSSKYSSNDTIKLLSTSLKHVRNRDLNSVEDMFSESKGYSWPKNFLMSKIASNAKRYLSVVF